MNLVDLRRLSILDIQESLISPDMEAHINLWNQILAGTAPWNKEAPCSGVIDSIAGAIDDNVAEEMSVYAESERLQEAMDDLTSRASDIVQYMALCGGCVVRPVYAGGKLKYELLQLGNYIPTNYDMDGTLTGVILIKDFSENGRDYSLVEKHLYLAGTETVKVMLYEKRGERYEQRALTATSKSAELTEEYIWKDIPKPMFVEFRSRKTNNIDGSRVPVAIYSGRENLIEDADRQYGRINWEQEAGEMRVFASADLFKNRQGTAGGKVTVTPTLQKLLVKINDSGATGDKIQEYSPNLRTQEQVNALEAILRRIEICCKLGKGTLSDLEDVRMTATQYQGGKKVLYTTVDAYESELEQKYRHVAWCFAWLLSAYERVPLDDRIIVSYNDAARKDPDQMRLAALQELSNGIISKAEYRMRIFGEDEETAKAKVPEVEPQQSPFGGIFG